MRWPGVDTEKLGPGHGGGSRGPVSYSAAPLALSKSQDIYVTVAIAISF